MLPGLQIVKRRSNKTECGNGLAKHLSSPFRAADLTLYTIAFKLLTLKWEVKPFLRVGGFYGLDEELGGANACGIVVVLREAGVGEVAVGEGEVGGGVEAGAPVHGDPFAVHGRQLGRLGA